MASYVGVDAGGSGSRWARIGASPAAADVLAGGDDGPPIQVAELGVEESVARLTGLFDRIQATGPFAVAIVGLAGGDDPQLRSAIAAGVAAAGVLPDPLPRIHVVGDTITGAAAALHDRPGVALFAGTGSFAMARGPDGALLRVGGRGNRVSDHGSGYRITLAAAEAVYLAAEGMAPETSLGPQLCAILRAESPLRLGVAFRRCSAAEVARGFRVVVEHAEAGDAVARATLQAAADSLAAIAAAARERARLPVTAPVVLGGGTQSADLYREFVTRALQARGLSGEIGRLATAPARGAAILARAVALGEVPLAGWIDG